ncbi:EamA family transporter, partial [Vibrio parahaemolyticus]|nr:EamA family transporter [Vibrio parahaemolyticus]
MKSFEKRKLIKGFGYGALTVGCWGILNVTTHEALSSGFLPNDLTMLRYCVAGIICLPLMLINLRGVMQITNWLRATAFSLLAGPMYGWLVNKGMQLTPLSYASVMVPTFTMIITMAFL